MTAQEYINHYDNFFAEFQKNKGNISPEKVVSMLEIARVYSREHKDIYKNVPIPGELIVATEQLFSLRHGVDLQVIQDLSSIVMNLITTYIYALNEMSKSQLNELNFNDEPALFSSNAEFFGG